MVLKNSKLIDWLSLLFWALGTAVLIYVASIDLYAYEQFLLGLVAIVSLIVMRWYYMRTMHKTSPLRLSRLVMMVIAGFLSIHYLAWRIQFSIPWNEGLISLILSFVLLGAEIMAVALYFMGAVVNMHPLWREPKPIDLTRPDLPTVDVFVPTYDEQPSLLRTTLLAALSLDYPKEKLNVYLLDDGGTDAKCAQEGESGALARKRRETMQALCRDVGANYLTRADNQKAKAGNINAALLHTRGEIVVVFDSDHVPTVDFLRLTVGTMMSDAKIALVQTPHFMINRDPIEKNLRTSPLMPGEGEMFYSLNLRGMDNWQAGFFCGSGALLRRSALEKIGGICTQTLVEDAETSLELLNHGYRTAYIHRPMLAGLNPESMRSYVIQRQRWASGMVQLLRKKSPFQMKNLNFMQSLSYFNCISFWLFSLARQVFLVAPILALLFGAVFFAAPPREIVLYAVPYLIALVLILNVLFGRIRWLFVSDVYEFVTSTYIAGSVFKTLLWPRKPRGFNVTQKGEAFERDLILSGMATFVYAVVAIQVVASIYGLYLMFYGNPEIFYQALIALGWNTYNMIFTLSSLGTLVERRERRRRPRVGINEIAQVRIDGSKVPCQIVDMSEDGARIRLPKWVETVRKQEGELHFSAIENKDATLTRLISHMPHVQVRISNSQHVNHNGDESTMLGVVFGYRNMEERRLVVNYVYGDSERWRQSLLRRNGQSTIMDGVRFLAGAVYAGVMHIVDVLRLLWERLFPHKSDDNMNKQENAV